MAGPDCVDYLLFVFPSRDFPSWSCTSLSVSPWGWGWPGSRWGGGSELGGEKNSSWEVRSDNWRGGSQCCDYQLLTANTNDMTLLLQADLSPSPATMTSPSLSPSHHPSDLQCRGHLQWRVSCPAAPSRHNRSNIITAIIIITSLPVQSVNQAQGLL